MDETRSSQPTFYTAEDIDGLAAVSLGTLDGVTHRVLWRNDIRHAE